MLGQSVNHLDFRAIMDEGKVLLLDLGQFAKLIGCVNTEAAKRDPRTETQHELFSSLPEQWEPWVDRLRFQPACEATDACPFCCL